MIIGDGQPARQAMLRHGSFTPQWILIAKASHNIVAAIAFSKLRWAYQL
jgi:hypothetical protein